MKRLLLILFCLTASTAHAADWWGQLPDGGTLYFYTNTLGQDGEGETPASEAVVCYKDGSDTELTTGVAIDDDIDSVTGLHRISVDTTQTGFDAGSRYTIVYSAGTSDSVSIAGRVVGSFALGPQEADVVEWLGTTVEAPVTETDIAGAVWDAPQTSYSDAGSMGQVLEDLTATAEAIPTNPLVTNDARLDFLDAEVSGAATPTQVKAQADTALADYDGPTNAELTARTLPTASYFDPASDPVANVTLVGTLTTYTGNTPQTGDSYARLGAPDGASLSDDLSVVASDVQTNTGAIGTANASLTSMKGATFNTTTDSLEALRNRGDASWITATGFATASNVTTSQGVITTAISALNDFDPSSDVVTTDSASRTASQADVSGLATAASIAAPNDLDSTEAQAAVEAGILAKLPGGSGLIAKAGSTNTDLDDISGGGGSAQTGDVFALLDPLISGGAYTAPALANAPSGGGGTTSNVIQSDPDPDCLVTMSRRSDGNYEANGVMRMRVGEQPIFAIDVSAILGERPATVSSMTATAEDGTATTDLVVTDEDSELTGVRDSLVIGKATSVVAAGTYKVVAVVVAQNGSTKKVEAGVVVVD